ncbi:16235_t:CDS:2 [Cetraspora pellucida]|uniref:16235_t:CDS:1 n=1 Tax=Cetraspora pellucida TaxID=1433469 RepID=A0ACA9M356_9GLOM|nr:16235_t:CDS:2 [Cetraspora pellucida]
MAQQNPVNPPNQPNAIDNLAAQIGALVQQMQAAPAPQINYNAPAREINLVMYPDFAGGDQDPMTWLDEVEKAFAANLVDDNRKIAVVVPHLKGSAATWWATIQRQLNPVNVWDNAVNPAQSFRPTFIAHFRTPTLEGKWFAQLATRKQQPNEDVDAYYTSIQELLRRVESGGHQYPETAKAQIFLNGLRPEFVLAVAPSTSNTLQAAYERAKAYESACKQNLSYHSVPLSALYSAQSAPYVSAGFQPSTSASESAIEKLTEAVNKMLIQFQDRRSSGPGNSNRPVCYKCGRVGHISRNCQTTNPPVNFSNPVPTNQPLPSNSPQVPVNHPPNPHPSNHVNPIVTEVPENRQQETLQTLLALAASLNPSNNQHNQHTYVSIVDEDAPLFATGKRDPQRASSIDRPTKRRKEGVEEEEPEEETLEQLLEEEGNREENGSHQETFVKPHVPSPKVTRPKRVPVIRRKGYTRKELHVPTPNVDKLPPLVYYDPDSNSSSKDEWYRSQNGSIPKEEAGEFSSDADDVVDEERRLSKIRKKYKNKPLNVIYLYDEAGNAYIQGSKVKPDPRSYIASAPLTESWPINDIFDYFYEERQPPYQIGQLESKQYSRLQQFLNDNLDLFVWKKGPLGRTNIVKHRIDTGNTLPIKQYPYRHSPVERNIIKTEISHMISEGIIRPLINESLYKTNPRDPSRPLRVLKKDEIRAILFSMHDDPLAGHFGFQATYQRIATRYYWPQIGNDIKEYVRTCEWCQKKKKPCTKEPLYPIKIGQAFDRIGIDIVGPLPITSKNNRYIVVATEYLTKWPEARPIEKADAVTVADFIFEDLICRHGCPKELLSDQGSHFCNQIVDALCQRMNIIHHTSTAYHPQTNGLVERFNRTLCGVLNKCVNQFGQSWDEYVLPALFAYRTTRNHTTGYEPFYLLYGRSALLPIETDSIVSLVKPDTEEELEKQIYRRINTIYGDLIEA